MDDNDEYVAVISILSFKQCDCRHFGGEKGGKKRGGGLSGKNISSD